ncbi:MAG: site-specific integrase [Dehalococcoidia bacterium]|nr:site-specific integrase [Dehalococcoidia bacterium]
MRGSIQQRSPGSWFLRYDGPEIDGKRHQVAETVRGTRKTAERALRERMAVVENGGYLPKQRETVADYMKRWLETYCATNTTPRTQQGYRGYVNRYVNPSIGAIHIQALTGRDIQGLYSNMVERGLSATTIVQLHRIVKESLSHAVKWGILSRNPADAATPPRKERVQMEMWDIPTIHVFLQACDTSHYASLYRFAILTGMRRSELTGLRWANVDLKTFRVSVVETLQRITGQGLVVGQPKTARSRRSIALSPDAVKVLEFVRDCQTTQRLMLGDAWTITGYVFTRPDGRPVIPDDISEDFQRVVRKAELPHLTLHGLRHAHATIMLMAGVHPKVVSERLGHSNIAVTMDTYSHVLPGLQEAAACVLDQCLATTDNTL